MWTLISAVIQAALLTSVLRTTLRRLEPERTFSRERVVVAAAVVVGVYSVSALADYLYHWKSWVYLNLPFTRSFWGSVAWRLSAFPLWFAIQWAAYSAIVTDTRGAKLSPRSYLWLAAIPTAIALLLAIGWALVMGVVFYAIGSK